MDFLLDALTNWLKEMLVGGIMGNLSGMFDSVNQQVADISAQVGQTPQGWNGSIFSMIQNLSNSIMVPIAGVILAIVMTLELIQMITDRNNLHDVDTWMIFKWVFKSAAAILLVTNTWNLVMAVFDMAQSVVAQASGIIGSDASIDISAVMTDMESRLMDMDLGPLFGLWFQSLFIGITMWALYICIFIVIYGRMIEIYLVTSVAPIPMATMMGKEWGGMGQNYLRSLLALGFQAFLIIVCVAIYAVLVQNIATEEDIIMAIWSCVGYTVLLCFTLEDKPRPPSKLSHTVRDAPGNAVAGKLHQEIRKTEDGNVGVESAHKSEEAVETGVHLAREGYRSHKLKPYRKAAQAERKLEKANIEALFQKSVYENPAAASNPLSRWQQKQQIKKQYAAAKRAAQSGGSAAGAAQKTGKAAKTVKEKAQQAGAYVMRHKKGFGIVLAIFLLVCLLLNTMSSCSMMAQSIGSMISGTTYPSDDPELVAVEADYAAKEAALQAEIDNIESSHPGYDEYRYDLDMIGHDPHELAAYLSAVLQGYTRASAQAELERIFAAQYQLTLTEEVEVRYRTETRTDSEGNEYDVEVPYNYYILNVTLTSKPISSVALELLTPDQLEMYQVYRQTLGNKPLIFGGGSADTSDSESLAGVEFVNGTRPGNQAVVDIAKSQVGNVGGQPYWSWYGFNSRVEWCACFVSWCYGQMGLSEPRFAACQSQGIPWFQSHGQWGGRDYANIAPGDAIFFDWDLDGSADHVGIVVGTDGSRVYTVEGNSGDACKIKSYSLTYECIKGYGLMNW